MFTAKMKCASIEYTCTDLNFNNLSYAENLFSVKQIAVKELRIDVVATHAASKLFFRFNLGIKYARTLK